MPDAPKLVKAEIREIKWNSQQQAQEINRDKWVKVQFNPETLKVNFSNQNAGGDQRGGSAVQFVGSGTTKLTLDIWFDVTKPPPDDQGETFDDVRRLTEKVNYFIKPKKKAGKNKWIPPGVRFIWGTFLFDGIMDSMNETLEYFSEDGKPLRANVSIGLTSQTIQFEFGEQQAGGGLGSEGAVGTQPLQQAKAGKPLQQMAAEDGNDDWKSVAEANNIENPRQLPPGSLIDMNAAPPISGGASAGAGLGGSAGIGLGGSATAGLAGSTGLSLQGSTGIGVGGTAGAELGGSLNAGLGSSGQAGGAVSFDQFTSFEASAGLAGSASAGGQVGFSGSAGIEENV